MQMGVICTFIYANISTSNVKCTNNFPADDGDDLTYMIAH